MVPQLLPKLYYGQPGWTKGGKVVCSFRSGQMDKLRYSTLGVSGNANLDQPDGPWAASYALIGPSDKAWAEVEELVRAAARRADVP